MPLRRNASAMSDKPSFRQRQFEAREDAILDATHALLATKGYDLTTMDEVAAEVGIAKASLYKHFPSKEALATAAMVRTVERTLTVIDQFPPEQGAMESLRALLAWALRLRLAGGLPSLPASNSALRDALVGDVRYMAALAQLTARIGMWIQLAKAMGHMRTDLADEVVMLSLFARSCDPTVDFLKQGGAMGTEEIVEAMLTLYFDGLRPITMR